MKNKNKFLTLAGCAILAQIALACPVMAQDNSIETKSYTANFNGDLPIANFETLQTGTSGKVVVFIGGANDTFHYWDKHIEELKCQNVTIVGYEGLSGKNSQPFNSDYLDDNAKTIATGIQDLSVHGYKDIQWIAHSVGGVASLKAAHIIEENKLLPEDVKVNLVAVNSPVGGYSVANAAMYTPFFRPISKSLNLAMASDMSPNSNFYESISKPLSGFINTTLIESKDDTVAQPDTEETIKRYQTVSNTFSNRILVNGDHELSEDPDKLLEQNVDLTNARQAKVFNNIDKIRSELAQNNKSNKPKV